MHQMLARVSVAVALVAALWTQPSVHAARAFRAADDPTMFDVKNVGAGCDNKDAYPEPMTTTTYSVSSVGDFTTLHFSHFNLPPNDYVVIFTSGETTSATGGNEASSFTYRGDTALSSSFAATLFSDTVTIQLVTKERAEPRDPTLCKGFTIDKAHDTATPATKTGSEVEEVCGADNTREAACFNSDGDKNRTSRAVMRLLIHKETGSFFCTGWLLGCEGHVVTNNHCISTQAHASSTEFEFDARRESCDVNCQSPLGCPGKVVARSSTFVTTSVDLDYTLVKLDNDWWRTYGYLQLRESGATMDDNIYIPQHPSGWGMRIATKDDSGGFGSVLSLSTGGCAVDQVAYNLDTRAGSSGSPVISTTDNAVIALHHCGGCPNTAINSNKIVADLRARNMLPKCAVYNAPTPAPVTPAPIPVTSAPVPVAPAPAPVTLAPAPVTSAPAPVTPLSNPRMTVQRKVDGTIFATGSTTSVDYIDFTLSADSDVELDILSAEEVKSESAATTYVDVNGDCNAAFLDAKIILFQLNGNAIAQSDVIAQNNDAPAGYGTGDSSVSSLDSYMLLPLKKGSYRLAVGTASMSKADAVSKTNGATRLPRACNAKVSNYGNYRLTLSASVSVEVVAPGSYIGSQCGVSNPVQPFNACPYHKEAALSSAATVEGTIVRSSAAVSVDHIPFTVSAFGRVSIEVSSYETQNGEMYLDINGHCQSAYIDPVVYLFRASSSGGGELKTTDLINAGDDDDNFALRTGRHSISFRDPFFSLALPAGDYVLAVGRYPLSVDEAIARSGKSLVDRFTPESCGAIASAGHYLVTIGSSRALPISSPNSFTGQHCTPSDRTNPVSICPLL